MRTLIDEILEMESSVGTCCQSCGQQRAQNEYEMEWESNFEWEAPSKSAFRYVKSFASPDAECVGVLKTAGKTHDQALTIINTQIGVAIKLLRAAADKLQRGGRTPKTKAVFQKIFRVAPEFVPKWLKVTATIKDRGDVIARRCRVVADMLGSGMLKYYCTINATNCPDCTIPPTAGDRACSIWGKHRVVCLGPAFWDAMKTNNTAEIVAVLMHEPFHIAYGREVTAHRADSGKFGGIYCTLQFVFDVNEHTNYPARVSKACTDTLTRSKATGYE